MWPSLVSAGLSLIVALLVGYKARNSKRDDDALERRFLSVEAAQKAVEAEAKGHVERLHAAELRQTVLEGDLRVASTGHQSLERDVAEIKAKMVHRDEWETQMENLREHLESFGNGLAEVREAVLSKAPRKRR